MFLHILHKQKQRYLKQFLHILHRFPGTGVHCKESTLVGPWLSGSFPENDYRENDDDYDQGYDEDTDVLIVCQ